MFWESIVANLGGVTSPKQEVALDTGELHSVCAFVRVWGISGCESIRAGKLELKGAIQ